MEGFMLGVCFGSCLKGEENNLELYEVLGFDSKNVTQEEIRQAFRKKTLQLHPDKLAQRGIKASPEDSMKFMKAKEAHDILSDSKRRKRYDQLGLIGLKIVENPREINPSELIKNFKRNQADRYKIALILGVVFCIILIFPILFALKCDGTIPDAPWLAIWTPIWFVDLLLFMAACALCAHRSEQEDDEAEPQEKITSLVKVVNFLETLLFILIQLFVLLHLDKTVAWSWGATFSPWYIYECVSVFSLVGTASQKLEPPSSTEHAADVEEGVEEGVEDPRVLKQKVYFEKLVNKISSSVQIVCSLLRLWQAGFLAAKLDGADWNWGAVFTPVWLYFAFQYAVSRHYKFTVAARIIGDLDVVDIQQQLQAGGAVDPLVTVKLQQYEQMQATGTTVVCAQIVPVFMAIMLVCRLEAGSYSTFLIILPVFLIVGCCCICSMCCVSFLPLMFSDEPDGNIIVDPVEPPHDVAQEAPVYRDEAVAEVEVMPSEAPEYGTFVARPASLHSDTADFLSSDPVRESVPSSVVSPSGRLVVTEKEGGDSDDDLD